MHTSGIDGLIQRTVPDHLHRFRYELILDGDATDHFEISTTGETVSLRGSSTRAISAAFGRYLRDVESVDLSWDRGPARLSGTPPPHDRIEGATPYPWCYYFNYVTFAYSTAFWDWERWELEIDWMALRHLDAAGHHRPGSRLASRADHTRPLFSGD